MFHVLKIVFLLWTFLLQVTGTTIDGSADQIVYCGIYCELPPLPLNGSYLVISSTISSSPGDLACEETIIEYKCDHGFEPYVKSTAICRKGQWETEFSKCQKVENCILPEYIGGYETKIIVPNWTLLKFSCVTSFDLIGYSFSICQGGSWVPPVPHCEMSHTCTLPEYPKHGRYQVVGRSGFPTVGNKVQELTELLFSCDDHYKLVGDSIVFCQNNRWSTNLPHCQLRDSCTLPEYPTNGRYHVVGGSGLSTAGSQVQEFTVLSFSCDDQYKLVGAYVTYCQDKRWSNSSPQCQLERTCILPQYPENGRYLVVGGSGSLSAGNKVQEYTTLTFSCNDPYYLIGDNSMFCYNDNWSSKPPQCMISEECSDIQNVISGVYWLKPGEMQTPFQAYCDMNVNGNKWTVIQSRFNGSVDFYRNYKEYSEGFGSPHGEYWLGLERMHQITKRGTHELYVELQGYDGTKKYARYSKFSIGSSSSSYKLSISGYSGTAGDSMTADGINWSNDGMKFSTYDNDQDAWPAGNRAIQYHGGWWYSLDSGSQLNARYHYTSVDTWESMNWWAMYQKYVALKSSRMMIRRI